MPPLQGVWLAGGTIVEVVEQEQEEMVVEAQVLDLSAVQMLKPMLELELELELGVFAGQAEVR